MTEYKYYTITLATIDDSNFGISEIRDDKMNTYSTSDVSMNINDKTVDFGAILDEFMDKAKVKSQNVPDGKEDEIQKPAEADSDDDSETDSLDEHVSNNYTRTLDTDEPEPNFTDLTKEHEPVTDNPTRSLGGKSRFSKKKRHSKGNKSFKRHKK